LEGEQRGKRRQEEIAFAANHQNRTALAAGDLLLRQVSHPLTKENQTMATSAEFL